MDKHIYLDNSATTKPCEECIKAIEFCLKENWGNPSSSYTLGIDALETIEKSRHFIASFIGAKDDEIFFTSCGTEANNLAIKGTAHKCRKRGNKIISTTIEHPSVLNTLKQLETEGFDVVLLSPDENGKIRIDDLEKEIDKNTILVSVMLVNNELGTIQPIHKIKNIIKEKSSPALIHCDAVQGFGKLPIKISSLGVDLLSASGHKIHASKGIGFLYKSKSVNINPIIDGGGQEFGIRSGTECVPLIAGFSAAVNALPPIEDALEKQKKLYLYLKDKLQKTGRIVFNSPDDSLPYILNISVEGFKSEPMMNALSAKGIFLSKGSACAKGQRSYVLKEIGLSNDRIDSALRISMSRDNTFEEIDCLCENIISITDKMRRFKG